MRNVNKLITKTRLHGPKTGKNVKEPRKRGEEKNSKTHKKKNSGKNEANRKNRPIDLISVFAFG